MNHTRVFYEQILYFTESDDYKYQQQGYAYEASMYDTIYGWLKVFRPNVAKF